MRQARAFGGVSTIYAAIGAVLILPVAMDVFYVLIKIESPIDAFKERNG